MDMVVFVGVEVITLVFVNILKISNAFNVFDKIFSVLLPWLKSMVRKLLCRRIEAWKCKPNILQLIFA